MNSTWNCRLCQDIYQKRGSVESFITHFNKDHTRQELPNPCLFQVFQCPVCKLITKSRRGLSRHINAKHRSPSSLVPNYDGASFSAESASMEESPKTDRSECASVHESSEIQASTVMGSKTTRTRGVSSIGRVLTGSDCCKRAKYKLSAIQTGKYGIKCFIRSKHRQHIVTISETPSCSCSSLDQCVHQLYVFQHVFEQEPQVQLSPIQVEWYKKNIPPHLFAQYEGSITFFPKCPICFQKTSELNSICCKVCNTQTHTRCLHKLCVICQTQIL